MCPSYTQGAEHDLAPELQNWVLGWSETPCIILIHNRYFQHHQIYWSVGSRGRATCATAKTGCRALSCSETHLKLTASFNEWVASVFPKSCCFHSFWRPAGHCVFLSAACSSPYSGSWYARGSLGPENLTDSAGTSIFGFSFPLRQAWVSRPLQYISHFLFITSN